MRDFVKFPFSHFLSLWLRKCQKTSLRAIYTQSANCEGEKGERKKKLLNGLEIFFSSGRIKVGDDKKDILCALLSERQNKPPCVYLSKVICLSALAY